MQRFDFRSPVFNNLGLIDPAVVLSRDKESLVPLARLFPNLVKRDELQTLDTEWRLLRNDWILDLIRKEKEITVENFWNKIENLKEDGIQLYPLLSTFVGSLLTLPHSSAACERIFFKVSLFKTKTRNNMGEETICGLLHTDALVGDYACHDFPIEKRLLNMLTTLVYK